MNLKNVIIKLLIIISFCCFNDVSLYSDTIEFDFNNTDNIQYNSDEMEVYNGQLRLNPRGRFWTNTEIISPPHNTPNLLFQDPEGTFFYGCGEAGPDGALYRSTNYGSTWETIIPSAKINDMFIASDNNYYMITGTSAGGGVYKSYNKGIFGSWSSILSGRSAQAILEDSNNALYASINRYIVFNSSSNILYKSYNYGTNWVQIFSEYISGSGGGSLSFRWLFELNNGNLIAGRKGEGNISDGVCISSNYGTNWSLIRSTSNLNYYHTVFRAKDDYVYIAGIDGILRTIDEGQTWDIVSSEECSMLMETYDGLFYKIYNTNIWMSPDKGYNWQKLPEIRLDSTNCCLYMHRALFQADDGKIYVGGKKGMFSVEGAVFKSGYISSSQAILDFKPQKVDKWESFSCQDSLSVNINYEFMYSTNAGIIWSSWLSLTDSNLQEIKCSADGRDQIKVRITMNSINHNSTPVIDWFKINYLNKNINITDLDNVVVAPNPYDASLSESRDYIMFFNLTPQFEMKIYSATGGEVVSIKGVSKNGTYRWIPKNSMHKNIKPGVYICYITDSAGHEKKIKLVIIR